MRSKRDSERERERGERGVGEEKRGREGASERERERERERGIEGEKGEKHLNADRQRATHSRKFLKSTLYGDFL